MRDGAALAEAATAADDREAFERIAEESTEAIRRLEEDEDDSLGIGEADSDLRGEGAAGLVAEGEACPGGGRLHAIE